MERQKYLSTRAFKVFLGASILTALSAMLGNVVDGIIVSHLIDYNAMSATSLSKPIIQIYYTLFQLIGLGGNVLIAKAMGGNDFEKVNRLFSTNIMVLGALSVLITFVGLFFTDEVASLMCGSAELHGYVVDYFAPTLIFAPVFIATYFLGGTTAIDGSPKLVSVAMIVDNVVNLLMDVVLIAVFDMGIMGSAIATVIGHVVACAIMLPHYRKSNTCYRLRICRWAHLGESCSTGAPFALASIFMTLYLYASQFIISTNVGTGALYVFSVVLNIMMIYNMFVSGACSTMQQLAALQLGLNDFFGHRNTVSAAFRFLNISLGVACVVLLCCPQLITRMFDCPDSLIGECCDAIRIYSVAFWLFCLLYLLMVNYKLLQRSALANFISFSLNLSVIPVIWILSVVSPDIIWWSNMIAYALVMMVVMVTAEAARRKNKELSPLTLLPKSTPFPTFELSFKYSIEDMGKCFNEISLWLKEQSLDDDTVFKVRVIAEELMSNVAEHGKVKSRKAFIDIRIILQPQKVILSIADDSVPFDTVANKRKGPGLKVANTIPYRLDYKHQFEQNITTATLLYPATS